jgi:pyruvate dehydrogenase E2 component (dihydrolipoamide acetyltransferase)
MEGLVKDFMLPDLGEGLTESELLEWHVAVGDTVALNQTLAEVETAKAIVQLPSPFAGRIAKLYAEPGTTVAVGAPIVGFEAEGGGEAAPAAPARTPVLVGYGVEAESGDRPKRASRIPKVPFPDESARSAAADETRSSGKGTVAVRSGPARTTPPVRKLAHDLGVDLHALTGTGPDGIITREDVTRAAEGARSGQMHPAQPAQLPETGTSDRRIPIKGVRKHTAEAMVRSAFTAPHATVFLTVDVTRTKELVGRLKAAGEAASLLGVIAKAVCLAVPRNPAVNSSWDEERQEIVEHGAVHLGIAVASERGLIVPVLRDAHRMAVGSLTAAIAEAAAATRDGSLPPERLTGGTIAITNVGVFGVDAGTPILVPGQAAILATGAVRRIPWEFQGDIALRDVMTLSLSFDHRLVDGEQGARFLADVGRILNDPGTALAM